MLMNLEQIIHEKNNNWKSYHPRQGQFWQMANDSKIDQTHHNFQRRTNFSLLTNAVQIIIIRMI